MQRVARVHLRQLMTGFVGRVHNDENWRKMKKIN